MAGGVIRAQLYDGRTSGSREAHLSVAGTGELAHLWVRAAGGDFSVPLPAVGIGERVGETNRLLQLPGGASVEVLDNAQFDAALAGAEVSTREAPLRRLESRWVYALAAVLATLVGTVGAIRYGIPALAARAVTYIPADVDAYVGTDSLRMLDRSVFQPSKLPPQRQAQLRGVFAEVAADAGAAGARYRLELRDGGSLGPNAFALPAGIVVLTDQLAQLAHNDDELRGVFAHEVGHLVNRHAMRMLVQDSGSALLLVGVFGDASAVSSTLAAAPTLLVNAAYSRDFEREADAFAFRWMRRHDVAPEHLGDLLERLGAAHGTEAGSGGFLASHPDLRERVNALRSGGAAPAR